MKSNGRKSSIKVRCPDLITDGALRLIETTISKHNTKDRNMILKYVCEEMQDRYPGESLEYHLKQMKLTTTQDILEVIDLFLIMLEIEPNTTFVRKHRTEKN